MLKRSRQKGAQNGGQQQEPPKPSAADRPSGPTPEYARLGTDAPIAWPSVGGRRVPVTGQLSPHAAEALRRMGITKD